MVPIREDTRRRTNARSTLSLLAATSQWWPEEVTMSLQVADPAGKPMEGEPPRHHLERGFSHPLGAHVDDDGVNFAIFSEHATGMQLLLFEAHDSAEPYQIITLDPEANRSFAIWHVYVAGLRAPAFYGLRVFGPEDGAAGFRFDPDKVLLDPYARGVDRTLWDRGAACRPRGQHATSLRSVVVDRRRLRLGGRRAPVPARCRNSVIYEMHVRRLHPLAELGRARSPARSPASWRRSRTSSTSASPPSS